MKYFIGIDIGSTCSKTVVMDENKNLIHKLLMPTGWSSIDTAENILKALNENGISAEESAIVATGYGRVSVPYADKSVTEITCHAKGACFLSGSDDVFAIDIGGQDTKIISIENGAVSDFLMNDKCSAGTGRFLEIMANTLSLRPEELCILAEKGSGVSISSMCTVFAESEVISLIGKGESRENIAFAVVDSIVKKVSSQAKRLSIGGRPVYLTGGLCEFDFLIRSLSDELGLKVKSSPDARFAGAIGAALSAFKVKK
ncbi:MAG: CoA activase [Lachnospiraceae bacterium]|nr:CoA activase [Lachnospiraceae bacterium]